MVESRDDGINSKLSGDVTSYLEYHTQTRAINHTSAWYKAVFRLTRSLLYRMENRLPER